MGNGESPERPVRAVLRVPWREMYACRHTHRRENAMSDDVGRELVRNCLTDHCVDFTSRYPIFIDAVIQSRGKGFVGTMSSTMSLLAMRRVQDWNDGVGKMIPRSASFSRARRFTKANTMSFFDRESQ